MTVPDLHQTIKQSYNPVPETHDLEIMYDISGWLNPHIVRMKNHVYPHTFRYFLGDDHKARMQYKNWAQDKVWRPDKEPITILETTPQGVPKILHPGLGGREIMEIKELQSKVAAGSQRMTDAQFQWWSV